MITWSFHVVSFRFRKIVFSVKIVRFHIEPGTKFKEQYLVKKIGMCMIMLLQFVVESEIIVYVVT